MKTAGDETVINLKEHGAKIAESGVEDDKVLLTFTRYKAHLGSA